MRLIPCQWLRVACFSVLVTIATNGCRQEPLHQAISVRSLRLATFLPPWEDIFPRDLRPRPSGECPNLSHKAWKLKCREELCKAILQLTRAWAKLIINQDLPSLAVKGHDIVVMSSEITHKHSFSHTKCLCGSCFSAGVMKVCQIWHGHWQGQPLDDHSLEWKDLGVI